MADITWVSSAHQQFHGSLLQPLIPQHPPSVVKEIIKNHVYDCAIQIDFSVLASNKVASWFSSIKNFIMKKMELILLLIN